MLFTNPTAAAAVIFCHGSGDTGPGVREYLAAVAAYRSECLNDPDARSRPGPRPLIALDDARRRFYVHSPRLVVASRLGRARGVDRPTVARWVLSRSPAATCARARGVDGFTRVSRASLARENSFLDALVRPLWVGPSRAGVCGAASARAWNAIKRRRRRRAAAKCTRRVKLQARARRERREWNGISRES